MNDRKTIGKRQDRLIAFFDAIMAIAMTVLALEITIPQFSKIDYSEKQKFFVSLTCYLISFIAMCTLWYVHNNFFSTHDLSGNNIEIVLHLVLLFFITLFQPLTRSVGEHPTDTLIRVFYLTDFIAMYGLMTIIIILIRKSESKLNERKNAGKAFVKERRAAYIKNNSTDDIDNVSDETKELRRIMKLVYAVHNPEVMQEEMAEYMPEEYKQEISDLKKKREESYRISLYSVFIMAIAVFISVVTLIFSVWYSYIALALGLIAIFMLKHYK